MEYLKEFLIAIGGGTVVIIAFLTILKSAFVKMLDKTIDTAFDKGIEKYRNKLTRTTTAYEMLLKKELKFYEETDPYLAKLIPLVQDLVYNLKSATEQIDRNDEDYCKCLLDYLKIIPAYKNVVLLYQAYIPQVVFLAASALLSVMQDTVYDWENEIGKLSTNEEKFDMHKAEENSDKILKAIALLEVKIQTRLKELSEP